jgi:glucokinase
MRVLVGDIGGTQTRLALAQVSADGVELSHVRRYASAEAGSLGAIVRGYLDELRGASGAALQAGCAAAALADEPCELAALAVAGPVHAGRCKTTNLPWELDAEALAAELGLPALALLNDLEAIAWAVPELGEGDLLALHGSNQPAGGNACVIAAGTGLGVAGLHWDGRELRPFATEAGHVEFAPTDELEFGLTRQLRQRYGRVSWERVVSGQGIVELFEFLLRWRGATRPSWVSGGEAAARIAQAGERGGEPVCVETMDLFGRLFARFIGDIALAHMAVGGVYLAGGVTLSNLWLLQRPGFVDGVFEKGRMDGVVRQAAIRVITREHVALVGAGRFAGARRDS